MRKIFRLFYRVDGGLTRKTAGTGIGLALVRQLAEAMGGTVDVVNREPGAELSVSFPCVP
jgi:signal transduction histidine kinase